MKTSRLAVPANSSGGSYHRASVPASRVGSQFSDLKPSRWIRLVSAVGLLAATMSVPVSAVDLAWNPNPESDIATYRVSYGTSPGSRAFTLNAGLNTQASVSGLQEGVTYYFVVTATNDDGLESAPSSEISYQEPGDPSVPPVEPPPSGGTEIPTSGWTVNYASSQETEDEDGNANNAIDGDPSTYWISRWLTDSALPPHDLQIDTGIAQSIQGFRYLPRQDGYDIGNIGRYEFYVSMDGENWGEPVASGSFANSGVEKEVFFAAKTGRYVQLRALTDLNGGLFNGGILCCVAELNLLQGSDSTPPENQAPVAEAQSVIASEDSETEITLVASDIDGDSLSYSIVSGPASGSLSGTAPDFTYTPDPDYDGADSFTFRVNDGALNSNTATVSINVIPVNDAPVAASGSASTTEDTPTSLTLSASDRDSASLSYVIVRAPGKGSLTGTAPNLTYRPDADENGADSFTFRASDGAANSNTATVSITITPVNDAPVVVSKSATTAENAAVSIVLSGTDKENSALTYSIVNGPAHGALSGNASNLIYLPASGFSGSDSFTYRANDGSKNSNTGTVSITVTPVNEAPVAVSAAAITSEDSPVSIVLSAGDEDGDSMTYRVLAGPAKGSLSGTAPNLTYTPTPDANGADSFTFRVNDGTVNSNTATVSITITPENDAPVVVSKSVNTAEDASVSITLAATDKDGDELTYSIVSGPAKGSLSGDAPNLTYVPEPGISGSDSFTYRANDGSENSNTGTISITVTEVSDAPVAVSTAALTAEDTPVNIVLSASDADGDSLTYQIVGSPAKGALSGTAPDLRFTPSPDANGPDSFSFRVNDGATNSNTATVSITITPVNDAPVAVASSATTSESEPVSIVLTATDKDSSSLAYAIVRAPAKGVLSGAAPNLTYTPTAGASGADSFTFRANDGAANSNVATVSITVNENPPPPNVGPAFAANPISMTAAEDQAFGGQLAASDPDESGALIFSKRSGPSWLTVSPSGRLGGMPTNADVGINSFSVRVTDSSNARASASLLVTVTNTNDAPVFTINPIDCPAASEDVPYSGESIAGIATDADAGDVVTFSKVSGPEWLDISAEGDLSGTPPAGSASLNTFVVRATDEEGATGDSVLQIQVNSVDLPLPWSLEDLAKAGLSNRASYESGEFTLEGSGQLDGSSDSGCFVWQSLSGDGLIVARLTSAGDSDGGSRAGVMIRDSLAPNAKYLFMGADGHGGFCWQGRTSTGESTKRSSIFAYGQAPNLWVGLVRKGQKVTAYGSINGYKWYRLGSVNMDIGNNCYIGLAVGSGGENSTTATFSNVKVR